VVSEDNLECRVTWNPVFSSAPYLEQTLLDTLWEGTPEKFLSVGCKFLALALYFVLQAFRDCYAI